MALLLQFLDQHHLDVARDASFVAAAGASTTTRPTCSTGILRGSRWSLLRAPAGDSTAPATGRATFLVSLDGHVGSTVIGASNHTTSNVGNLTSVHPPTFTDPSSIVVGNGSALSVASVGDSALPGPFDLNNVLVTLDIIQNLLSIHRFTTGNWCSMEFDSFGLSVKDLSTQNVITRCSSSGPLYMMCLPSHPTPLSSASASSALVASASTWHRHLGHPSVDVPSKLSHDSTVICTKHSHDLCHMCQLHRHIRLPFVSSNSRADNIFDLIHCDIWTSLVVSVSDYKYYLVILDDHSYFV
jgi:hypothetical protein